MSDLIDMFQSVSGQAKDLVAAQEELKMMIESYASAELVRARAPGGLRDDPFDAVYLSRLQPDKIEQSDRSRILNRAVIKDLSNEIEFDDDSDD